MHRKDERSRIAHQFSGKCERIFDILLSKDGLTSGNATYHRKRDRILVGGRTVGLGLFFVRERYRARLQGITHDVALILERFKVHMDRGRRGEVHRLADLTDSRAKTFLLDIRLDEIVYLLLSFGE